MFKDFQNYNLEIVAQSSLIANNFHDYEVLANNFLNSINTELESDSDFAEAESNIKIIKSAETKLKNVEQAIFSSAADVNNVLSFLKDLQKELAEKRLLLSKLVNNKKQSIKTSMIEHAINDIETIIKASAGDNQYIQKYLNHVNNHHYLTNLFTEEIKGKQSQKGIQQALDLVKVSVINQITKQALFVKQAIELITNENLYLFPDLHYVLAEDDYSEIIAKRLENAKSQATQETQETQAQQPAKTTEQKVIKVDEKLENYLITVNVNCSLERVKEIARDLSECFGKENVKISRVKKEA